MVSGLGSEAHGIQEFFREIGLVVEAGFRVVKFQRIDGLNFHAAYSCGLHDVQLACEFPMSDCGAEPPPAHHDAAVVGRFYEASSYVRQIGGDR